MAKSKKGLPKVVQAEIDAEERQEVESQDLAAFVNEMHGDGATGKAQEGIPSMEWLKEQFQTKSAIIRFLVNQNFTVVQIHKHTGWRYQHIRNVSTSPLKRGPNEDWRKPLLSGDEPDPKQFQPETKPKGSTG